MANPVTLLDLRTEVRTQTDAVADPHITDVELTSWINRGIRKLHAQIVQVDPDRLLVTGSVATTQGTLEYAVPSDFYAIRGLDMPEGGEVFTLRSYPFEERNRRRSLNGTASTVDLPRYRVARSGIDGAATRLLFDIDPGTRTYTLHYIPVPVALSADGDSVDDVLGFSDFVVAYAASRVRRKRNEPSVDEETEMARVLGEVRTQAAERHQDGMTRPPRTRRKRHYSNPLRW